MNREVLVPLLACLAVASFGARVEARRRSALVGRAGIGSGDGGVGRPQRSPRRRAAPLGMDRVPDEQLADAVAGMAAALRAGLSLPQALGYAGEEAEGRLRVTLGEIVERARYGEPLEAALERWAAGGGEDARLVSAVLRMHRRTGGGLPAVLDRIAVTLRERAAGRRELRSLTAQARLSGAVLGLLPIGFFLFLAVTSPEDLVAASRSSAGRAAIGVGLGLQGLAYMWIRRILRVV